MAAFHRSVHPAEIDSKKNKKKLHKKQNDQTFTTTFVKEPFDNLSSLVGENTQHDMWHK